MKYCLIWPLISPFKRASCLKVLKLVCNSGPQISLYCTHKYKQLNKKTDRRQHKMQTMIHTAKAPDHSWLHNWSIFKHSFSLSLKSHSWSCWCWFNRKFTIGQYHTGLTKVRLISVFSWTIWIRFHTIPPELHSLLYCTVILHMYCIFMFLKWWVVAINEPI